MAWFSRQTWLQIDQLDKVTVVRFTQAKDLDDGAFRLVRKRLDRLQGKGTERLRVVVNLHNVENFGPAHLDQLYRLHQHVVAAGGQLVLCGADAFVKEVFKVVQLPQIIRVFGEEREAVQAFQGRRREGGSTTDLLGVRGR